MLAGCEAAQRLELTGMIVGVDEQMGVGSELFEPVVVEALGRHSYSLLT